jgi:hypothetical protein
MAKGFRSAPAEKLCSKMVDGLPEDVLRLEVRETLKRRTAWSGKCVADKREVPVGVYLYPLSAATSAD